MSGLDNRPKSTVYIRTLCFIASTCYKLADILYYDHYNLYPFYKESYNSINAMCVMKEYCTCIYVTLSNNPHTYFIDHSVVTKLHGLA